MNSNGVKKMTTNNIFEVVKAANIDLLYLSDIGFDTTKQKGPCPIHGGDNKTAFSFRKKNKSNEYQYKCFTHDCVTGSDIIEVCRVKEKLESSYDACLFLADKYNIDVPKKNFNYPQKGNAIDPVTIEGALEITDNDIDEAMQVIRENEEKIDPKLYGPYKFSNKNSTLYYIKPPKNPDDSETLEPIYNGYLNINNKSYDIDDDKEVLILETIRNGVTHQTEISKGELFNSKKGLEIIGSKQGFSIHPRKGQAIQEYLFEQHEGLEFDNHFKVIYYTNNMGWYENKKLGIDEFIYPNQQGVVNYKENKSHSKKFSQKGDLAGTLEMLEILVKTKIGQLLLSSIAGSLIGEKINTREVLVLDIYGKNQSGKTIISEALASVFGDPQNYILDWYATDNGVITNATELNNFIAIFDDTKKCFDKEKISSIIYAISGGKEKARANKDGSAKEVRTFKNITLFTGETSVIDYNKGKNAGAGLHGRIISIDINKNKIFDCKEDADKVAILSRDNYGQLGPILCSYMADYIKENQDKLKIEYRALCEENYKLTHHETGARKANHIALLEMGARILNSFFEAFNQNVRIDLNIFKAYLIESDNNAEHEDIYKNAFMDVMEHYYINRNLIYDPEKDLFENKAKDAWQKDNTLIVSNTKRVHEILENHGDKTDILNEFTKREWLVYTTSSITKVSRTPYKMPSGKTGSVRTYIFKENIYKSLIGEDPELIKVQGTF